jgi:serine protease DegQ
MNRKLRACAIGLAISCSMLGAEAGVPQLIAPPLNGSPKLAGVLKDILPAVVVISAKVHSQRQSNFTSKKPNHRSLPTAAIESKVRAVGSGVVLDARLGLIVTNSHVIDRSDEVTVSLADGREVQAKLVGRDPETDVAVLKVKADGLTAIVQGDSDELQVGDFVLAIGNPFKIGRTVTSGIVSGLHRTNIGIEKYEDFIQTDAAIYPGNSGGALINYGGELVGINTAFIGAGQTHPGVGFAIPINMVRIIVDRLLEYGEIRRGELGISFRDVAPESISRMPFRNPPIGAVVAKTEAGSAAERAGLKPGDIVTGLDGASVWNTAELRNRLALVFVGQAAELTVVRGGRPPLVIRVVPDESARPSHRTSTGSPRAGGARTIY